MNKWILLPLLMFSKAFAQDSVSVQEYIDQYKWIAMAEMQRTGVPAAITLAQGIHESLAGKSDLVLQSNNHFGIKCKDTWTGKSVRHDDDARQECFRAYDSAIQSYMDHSNFLKNSARYAFLFKFDPLDYESWAKGLKQAGYATNPKYAPILIRTIQQYHLNDLTLLALNPEVTQPNMAIYAANISPVPVVEGQELVRQVPNSSLNVTSTYPTTVFSINNTKVFFVEKGTSLLAVAMINKISLPDLLVWNDMDQTDIALDNQLVFLAKKQKKGSQQVHEVKPGETLWQISQTEGVRLSSLLQFNKLSDINIPAPGEQLYLQDYSPKPPRLIR